MKIAEKIKEKTMESITQYAIACFEGDHYIKMYFLGRVHTYKDFLYSVGGYSAVKTIDYFWGDVFNQLNVLEVV